MNKVSLSDNSGRWFDNDCAKEWHEAVMVADDGTTVSMATGNSWEHETLYLTKSGSFVMHFVNDHNPTLAQYAEWDQKRAVKWLLANGHNHDLVKLDLANEESSFEM